MAHNVFHPNHDLLEQGWQMLVDNLGTERAKRFVLSFPQRKGDSVQYWKKFWGNKNVNEIYNVIERSKKK